MERLNNNNQKFHYQMEFVECDVTQANRSVGQMRYTRRIKEIHIFF